MDSTFRAHTGTLVGGLILWLKQTWLALPIKISQPVWLVGLVDLTTVQMNKTIGVIIKRIS